MSVRSNINKILSSSLLLRVVFVLSLFNLIGYLVYGDIHAVIFFILVAGLVKYFSKNMILVLGIPLFIVNLFVVGKKTKEGMDKMSKQDSNEDSNQDSNEDSNQDSSQDKSNIMKQKMISNKMNSNSSENNNYDDNSDNSNNSNNSNNSKKMPKNDESFEVGRKKGKYNIDYASTIEDAYDDLNKIIGSDGIKNLTSDTQNLMQQQLKLAETMKGMGPLIEQMGPLMQSFGPMMEQAKGFMGSGSSNIASLAKDYKAGK